MGQIGHYLTTANQLIIGVIDEQFDKDDSVLLTNAKIGIYTNANVLTFEEHIDELWVNLKLVVAEWRTEAKSIDLGK